MFRFVGRTRDDRAGRDEGADGKRRAFRLARYIVLGVLLISGAATALQLVNQLERRADGMTRYVRVDAWAVQQTEYELQQFRSQLARHVAGDAELTLDQVKLQLARVGATVALMRRGDYQEQFGAFVHIERAVAMVEGALRQVDEVVSAQIALTGDLGSLHRIEEILVGPSETLRQLMVDVASVRQELQDGDLDNVRWLIGVNKWALGAFFLTAAVFIALLILESRSARRAERETRYLAEHDSLTGLASRSVFFARVDEAIDAATRRDQQIAILLVDLDHFKDINDTLGHATGDALLRRLGKRLADTLRPGDLIARLGGDEFGVLLPAPIDEATACIVAYELVSALHTPFDIESLNLEVGASIGVTTLSDSSAGAAELLRQADVAMYAAKRSQAPYSVYDDAEDYHSVRHLTLKGELRRAVEEGQFALYYQPKIDLETQSVCGAEALIRWNHPERGVVSPDDFIPVAEQTDLIRPMTEWLVDTAAEQWACWSRDGIDIDISVNLSTRMFQDNLFADYLEALLVRSGIPADRLVLEITESVLISDPARAKASVDRLRKAGFQVSIDDYGTGYSSLAYLKDLQVNELKIDKVFVLDMLDQRKNRSIVESSVNLGRALGLKVVAEGVETAELSAALAAMGCDTGQGYFYSRPLPADAFVDWMRDSSWATKRGVAGTEAASVRRRA